MKLPFRIPRLPRPCWPHREPRPAKLPKVRKERPRRVPRPPAPAGAPSAPLLGFRAAALWAIAVVIAAASGAAFTESYRGLYTWALHHGLSGFWAAAFPIQVDSFIAVGELVLFVAMVDDWRKRDRAGAWTVSLLGLLVSIGGNIGHLAAADAQSRATAAVPPIAAFAALWLGLSVLKRVISHRPSVAVEGGSAVDETAPEPVADAPAIEAPAPDPEPVPVTVPGDAESAAEASMRATVAVGNPWSVNALATKFNLTRKTATDIRDRVFAEVESEAQRRVRVWGEKHAPASGVDERQDAGPVTDDAPEPAAA